MKDMIDFNEFVFDLDRSVVGNRIQVDRFTSALIGEKKYMDAIKRHGLDSPMTYKQRAKLNRSIQMFEKETGISWPLK